MATTSNRGELQSILLSTTVGELALADPPQLSPTDTVDDAARAMREVSHGCVVVCDGGRTVGIFTERDLLWYMAREDASLPEDLQTPLSEVMTEDPATLSPNATLLEAARHMDEGHYRRMPVTGEDGSSTGLVDVKSLTHFLVEHFPATIYNQSSYKQSLARRREGA